MGDGSQTGSSPHSKYVHKLTDLFAAAEHFNNKNLNLSFGYCIDHYDYH